MLNKVYAYKCSAYFLLVYIIYMKYKMHIHCFVYMDSKYIFYLCTRYVDYKDMNTAAIPTKRKNIDIREDVYRFLSIKAAASGTNLKSYIEALLEKDVEDMNESATYQYLCDVRPDGDVVLTEEETKDFENWLGI